MRYRKRRFVSGECMHVYQRTIGGVNIFYDLEDYIVFYTIFSIVSRMYRISVLELCVMIDHVHMLLSSDVLSEISRFVQHYTSLFMREYNIGVGRKGSLFHKSFGSAPKKGGKKIRSAIVYVGNNPVEKGLCKRAVEYRWNFLAYMVTDNPFSSLRPASVCSRKLRDAVREVAGCFGQEEYLSYARVRRMFSKLRDDEKETLTDYIIKTYFPFDKETLLSFYDSYGDMLNAMDSTSGSEYDLKEKYYYGTDIVYKDMLEMVGEKVKPVRQVTVLPDEEKFEFAQHLQDRTFGTSQQISKFLHMNIVARN